jgi:phosphatidylinositol dimannoside acyltransferase
VTFADSLTAAGFGIGWAATKRLPEPLVDRAFQVMADRAYRKQGAGVRQLRANLARVLVDAEPGSLDDITHEGMRRYLRYWSEVFRMPAWDAARIRDTFDLREGLDRLDAAMAAGQGAIMASPHSGNWDLAGAWACDRYGEIVTVVERVRPEALFSRFLAVRESMGMRVLPLGGEETMRSLVRGLRDGKLVCLVTDRDLAGTGVPVNFFGETASMPAGPATLSLLTGAPIMPVRLWHEPGQVHAIVDEALAIPSEGTKAARIAELTQTMANSFADAISAHPADWHMLQPLFDRDVRSAE